MKKKPNSVVISDYVSLYGIRWVAFNIKKGAICKFEGTTKNIWGSISPEEPPTAVAILSAVGILSDNCLWL